MGLEGGENHFLSASKLSIRTEPVGQSLKGNFADVNHSFQPGCSIFNVSGVWQRNLVFLSLQLG